MSVMMKCGHAANGEHIVDGDRFPCCVICAGIPVGNIDAYVVVETPDFSGRKARCSYRTGRDGKPCKIVDSHPNLAFFEAKPDDEMDRYYCGCYGWD